MSLKNLITCDHCGKDSYQNPNFKTMGVAVKIEDSAYWADVCSVECGMKWIENKVQSVAEIHKELDNRASKAFRKTKP